MGQPKKSAALRFRNQGMQMGKALDVHLVKNGSFPRYFRLGRSTPGESRVNDPALLHQVGTVTRVVR
jgi:hypothetical protein